VQGVEEALEVRVLPFVGTGGGEVILQLSITRSAPSRESTISRSLTWADLPASVGARRGTWVKARPDHSGGRRRANMTTASLSTPWVAGATGR
jgi:hypothetical protein